MEHLVVPHIVDELELVVREQVPVRVHDPLREPGRAGRVVDLSRLVGRGVERLAAVGGPRDGAAELLVDDEHVLQLRQAVADAVDPLPVGRIGDDHLRRAVAQPMHDRVVAVEH